MQPIWSNVAALAVAVIFYVWRAHVQARQVREQVLRRRVAYMLWVMAGLGDTRKWEPSLASD